MYGFPSLLGLKGALTEGSQSGKLWHTLPFNLRTAKARSQREGVTQSKLPSGSQIDGIAYNLNYRYVALAWKHPENIVDVLSPRK